MNIHIHSWFSSITGVCSKGSTELCSDFCEEWAPFATVNVCLHTVVPPRSSSTGTAPYRLHTRLITWLITSSSEKKSKAACCCLQWSEKKNNAGENKEHGLPLPKLFLFSCISTTDWKNKHQSCHLETMELDVTFWKTKGTSPEASEERKSAKDKGRRCKNKNTQHTAMQCIIRLAAVSVCKQTWGCWGVSLSLICGTLVSL